MVSWSPDHGKGGETVFGDLELVTRVMTAMLLRCSQDKTKGSLEDVGIASAQEIVEMLKGAVQLAIGAILDEQAREAQDAKDETLGERSEIILLNLG